jgi:acetyl esterase/lipase
METSYPCPSGERPARIYLPEAEGPLPVIVYLHGGGFVAGSIDACARPCANLADELGAIVVTPSYRLAPEAPFPAATDDTYAAVCWTAETIAEHGGDPSRIVVMGESAGGQLAAVAAQRARDEHGPDLLAQVLLYPTIDAEAATASRVEYAAGPVLSADAARGMWAGYLGDMSDLSSPLASPARAESLAGLPPALIVSAECDPMRDEGEDYGRALEAAGVPARVVRLEGLVHGVYNMSAYVPRVREFNAEVADFIAALMSRTKAGV